MYFGQRHQERKYIKQESGCCKMTTRILRPTGRIWWLFFFVLGYNPLPSLIQKSLTTLGFGKTANIPHTSFLQLLFASSYAKLWRRQWHPTPVLLPGKSHGRRSLVGCSPLVAKSQTWLSDFTFTFHFHALEKEMATHSSVLAWRIPGTAEPGVLPSMGLHRVGHN